MRTRIAVTPAGTAPRIELRGDVLSPRILSASASTAQVALVGTQMVLLAGDVVGIDVLVGAGCSLEIVEPVGTVAYGGRRESGWEVSIELADGATLIWQGQPFVISDGASVRRTTEVVMGAGARLLHRETLAFGRVGQRGGDLRTRFDACHTSGEPLLVEELDLAADKRERAGSLGENRVLDSIVALGWRPQAVAAEELLAFELAEPGTMVRRLGREHVHRRLDTCWQAWHRELLAAGRPG